MKSLNTTRITTNKTGMKVLTGWGAVNMVAGGIGYFTANTQEWKAFHGMNAIWGVTNAGIGLMGLRGTRKEMAMNMSCADMAGRYEGNKRLFLINGGLDFLYIGTAVFMKEHSKTRPNPAVWRGFGNSILIQGAFLLAFDGTMFAVHQSQNKKWHQLMDRICVSGNTVGLSFNLD